jgi:SAM-dependent methyltransferase
VRNLATQTKVIAHLRNLKNGLIFLNPFDPIKFAKNRAYVFMEKQQQALNAGAITEDQWYAESNAFFTTHYLAADNPRAQSGHSGDESKYRYTRMMVLEAIHHGGTFLDVGCANGYLVESLHKWLTGSGLAVEFYGLDFSEGMLELARRRLPQWQERFFLGNALYWTPPFRFNFVYIAGLEYVPLGRQQELVKHLFEDFTANEGRLILGPVTEGRQSQEMEGSLRGWGFAPSGYCEKSHQTHPGLARKLFWFDQTLP